MALLPWNNYEDKDVFFGRLDIQSERWRNLYPYRLLVVDAKDNSIIGGNPIVIGGLNISNLIPSVASGPTSYIATQIYSDDKWELPLPITPQQLSITDQYSISNTPTMRGVVEEHNGLKYKTIQASGTTGIVPQRATEAATIPQPSALENIFGGTLEAVGNLVDQATGFWDALTGGGHPAKSLKIDDPETSGTEELTGYYQALKMQQFLERYVQLKKDPKYKHWRLVFDVPKQNESFIVTPVRFSLKRSAERPMEMLFDFQFKAWKRIDLNQQFITIDSGLIGSIKTSWWFDRITNAISQLRSVIAAAVNVIKAVRSDINKIANILRQTSLLVKDLGDAIFTLADLPDALGQDLEDAWKDSMANFSNAFKRSSYQAGDEKPPGESVGSALNNSFASALVIRETTSSSTTSRIVSAAQQEAGANEGLSFQAVKDGALGIDAKQTAESSSLNNILSDPVSNFDVLNTVNVDGLTLTPEQQQALENELEEIRLITIDNLREYKEELLTLALDLSEYFGAGDATYAETYGRPTPKSRPVPMSIEENEILQAIYGAVQAYDALTFVKDFDDNKLESPLEYVGGLARQNNMTFNTSNAKIPVPVPFGLTIEEIAARYLGNADRWLEIATINGLRSPYIDEDGFILPLLSNATGRQFTVNDSEKRLYIDQQIMLSSLTAPAFVRNITNLEKLGEDTYLVTVDGLANLNTLKLSDNAKIQAYLPGTINSQNRVYIPTNQPIQNDDRTFEIDSVEDQELARISKVDWLLDDNGDLAVNGLGDFRLASGMTNLIQALKLKIKTKKGSLLQHMDYGLGIQHGVSVADIDNGSLIRSLNSMVNEDPRFSSIDRLDLYLQGNTLNIDMRVVIANTGKALPINFNIKL